ncbi:glycolate oxidase subunit GlcF [Photobacterium rosenbergii]|nr:glycolate oxidase subunit GlcF [Photobacterium rosenbergii]
MLTDLDEKYRQSERANNAVRIIKRCVHRGFCNTTCPTFIESGSQNRGPRGRIYLIRDFLQGKALTAEQRKDLDLCVACRSCETTCPAGIEFGQLIHIARSMLEEDYPRPWRERILRWAIKQVLPYPNRFSLALTIGRQLKPVLPNSIAIKIPPKNTNSQPEVSVSIQKQQVPKPGNKARSVILITGCAQDTLQPTTNRAAVNILSALGIKTQQQPTAQCCGAVHTSLCDNHKAQQLMRANIDAWWPLIEKGAEAIISMSSSCELMVTEYAIHLADDENYAEKASIVSKLTRNIGEIILEEDEQLSHFTLDENCKNIALHTPCSLRNGLGKDDIPTHILSRLGATFSDTEDNKICCGSGGTYSLLQPQSSILLRNNKIKALTLNQPSQIATSNLSCQMHISSGTKKPISHWVTLLKVIHPSH